MTRRAQIAAKAETWATRCAALRSVDSAAMFDELRCDGKFHRGAVWLRLAAKVKGASLPQSSNSRLKRFSAALLAAELQFSL